MAIGASRYIGLAVGAVALGVLGAGVAIGQIGPGSGHMKKVHIQGHKSMGWMARADANKDNAITADEIKTMHDNRFVRLDRDGDGSVSAADVEMAVKERVERMTKRLMLRFDKDRDGKITRDEFNRFTMERLSWLDLNGDGKVTRDELPRHKRHMMWR